MILSDKGLLEKIRSGELEISSDSPLHIGPASIDLSLGDDCKIIGHRDEGPPYDIKDPTQTYIGFPPKTFILGTTKETVKLSAKLAARIDGRSSIGRLGLFVHVSAGFIDPGFEGQITLEMYNLTDFPIKIPIGSRICQLVVEELDQECCRPYGHEDLKSKYQNQKGATVSKIDED